MKWKQIRTDYPKQWLLVEAISAYTEQDRRIVEELSIINRFSDSVMAMKQYQQLHREIPTRELYVLHTDRERLDIKVRSWVGVRSQ